MPLFPIRRDICCASGEPEPPFYNAKVTWGNVAILFVALAAIAGTIIGVLAIAANSPHGLAGLGAISQLGLPGSITMTLVSAAVFAALTVLIRKRCCRSPVPLPVSHEETNKGHQYSLPTKYKHYGKLFKSYHERLSSRNNSLQNPDILLSEKNALPQDNSKVAGKGLEDLPVEIVVYLLHYLDDRSKIYFGLTSRHNYAVLKVHFTPLVLKVSLCSEAFREWKSHLRKNEEKGASFRDSIHPLSRTVQLLPPYYSKIIFKEIQTLFDSILKIKNKRDVLFNISYSLQGMTKAGSEEMMNTVVLYMLKLCLTALDMRKSGYIEFFDLCSIINQVSLIPTFLDPISADEYLEELKQDSGLSTLLNYDYETEKFLLYHAETLTTLDKERLLAYKDLISNRKHRHFFSLILAADLKHKNKERIASTLQIIKESGHHRQHESLFLEMVSAYAFLGESEKATSLSATLDLPPTQGSLVASMARHCNASDLMARGFLETLLNSTKELFRKKGISDLGLKTVDEINHNNLINALAILIKKIGKSDPIIDEILNNNHRTNYAAACFSLCLSSIDVDKSFALAKEIKNLGILVALAADCLKNNTPIATACLDLALEVYQSLDKRDVVSAEDLYYLIQIAQYYSKIDLPKAEQIFQKALKAAKYHFSYNQFPKVNMYYRKNIYICQLPLLKAYIAIEQEKINILPKDSPKKVFDTQKCLAFVKQHMSKELPVSRFAELAEELALEPLQSLASELLENDLYNPYFRKGMVGATIPSLFAQL